MTEVTISRLPPAPLHALEIWGHPAAVAGRFAATTGFALPAMGRSGGSDGLHLIRFEPTVWLVAGDVSLLADILGDDGAITAVGGGLVTVCLAGKGWRRLLMEGGVFDAENPAFVPGCSATTIIEHVNVRLHVVNEDRCDAYIPLSFSTALLEFWHRAAATLSR